MRKKEIRFQKNKENPLFLERGKRLYDGIKGRWQALFFQNSNPVVLELGCGTGKYALTLAAEEPTRNFVAIDIKGARMWCGAQAALEGGLRNIAFLRTRIEWLDHFFGTAEVDEIYISFPDPRPKRGDAPKRLTSEPFLQLYGRLLKKNGRIHVKTDSAPLYHATLELVRARHYPLLTHTEDLYGEYPDSIHTRIQTAYEKHFLAQGAAIKYLSFQMP